MVITSIELNKKNKDRRSVYLDGRYGFSISEEDYITLNLYEKREVTSEELDYIQNTVNLRAAKSDAIRYLSMKLRCEKEVRTKLKGEGYDDSLIEKAIEEIKSMGYINDKMYVQKYLFDRSKLKPKAKKMLRHELMEKGISEDVLDEVLADWEVDESAVAEGLARRKFGKYDLNDEKVVKRVFYFLHHRGFSFELINEIVNKMRASDE